MSLALDTSGFLGAMDAAARYIGAGQGTEAALLPEIGKVLERAVQYTRAPGEEDLRERITYGLQKKFNTYAAGEISTEARKITPRISIAPKAGNAWWVEGGKFYLMNAGPRRNWGNRYARYLAEEKDRLADLALELQQYVPKVVASRGLTKQSWVQIGDALGVQVAAPAYVHAAVATDRQAHVNGTGTRTADDNSVMFQLVNSMPTLVQPRHEEADLAGRMILQNAFNAREKAIMIGIEKGIFDDLEKALKRFPGVALLR